MLEESSSEVTSSSAGLIMSPSIALSPNSLGSPEYGELDLWGGYDDNPMHTSHGHNSAAGHNHHHHPSNGNGGGGGVGTNQNGIHSHHHHITVGGGGGVGPAAILQPGNNHHLLHNSLSHGNGNHGSVVGGLGSAVSLMNNVVGAAHINRLAQGMVNELLAANGGNGLIAVENLIGNGNGGVTNNANLGSSRSSTSPSIGKLKCSRSGWVGLKLNKQNTAKHFRNIHLQRKFRQLTDLLRSVDGWSLPRKEEHAFSVAIVIRNTEMARLRTAQVEENRCAKLLLCSLGFESSLNVVKERG